MPCLLSLLSVFSTVCYIRSFLPSLSYSFLPLSSFSLLSSLLPSLPFPCLFFPSPLFPSLPSSLPLLSIFLYLPPSPPVSWSVMPASLARNDTSFSLLRHSRQIRFLFLFLLCPLVRVSSFVFVKGKCTASRLFVCFFKYL